MCTLFKFNEHGLPRVTNPWLHYPEKNFPARFARLTESYMLITLLTTPRKILYLIGFGKKVELLKKIKPMYLFSYYLQCRRLGLLHFQEMIDHKSNLGLLLLHALPLLYSPLRHPSFLAAVGQHTFIFIPRFCMSSSVPSRAYEYSFLNFVSAYPSLLHFHRYNS